MIEAQDGLMNAIRDRFHHVDSCPYQGERVFFENAGGALTLKSVVETSTRLATIPDNQGRDNPGSHELVRIINKSRDDMRVFFNAPKGQIFVGESGTELLFRLISAALLGVEKPGVVIGSSLEHPATRSAVKRWSEIAGIESREAPHNDETGTVTVEDYLPLITPDVKVATILHTSPVTGMGVDVKGIAAAIRKVAPDCLIIVDGIQHAAHGDIDIAAADVDGYVISPYKVFSRHGYGVAWVSDRLGAVPHNNLINGPESNWEMGTRDTAAYATMSDVVDYLSWLGGHFTKSDDLRTRIEHAGKAIKSHEKAMTDAMIHGTGNLKGLADMPEIRIIGGTDNPAREGLVSIVVEGVDSVDVVAKLNEQGIRTHLRKADHYSGNILNPLGLPGCIRVSLAHYNNREEVAKFLTAIRSIVDN